MHLIDCIVWFHCLEGQPDSIVKDIDDMVRSYVEKVGHDHFPYNLLSFFPL